MLADTHCHLNFKSFRGNLGTVIHNAQRYGITRIMNPGIDIETSREAVELASRYDEVYAAVGVHPNSAYGWYEEASAELVELAQHPKVVAIGEIGLDYYRDRTPRDIQISVFQSQLEVAERLQLPVVIHSRNSSMEDFRAINDILSIITDWVNSLAKDTSLSMAPGVLHSFSSPLSAAVDAVKNNFLIGITGPVTFNNADSLCDVVKSIELENILIETDAPFLTPHPYRGKRNEPANVRFVAEKIADLRGETLDNVASITYKNSERLFNW